RAVPGLREEPAYHLPHARAVAVIDDEAALHACTKGSPSVRHTSMISSATVWLAATATATSSAPTTKAAAPSPRFGSSAERGAARRASPATTRTRFAEPAFTASAAARSAVVPAR